MRFNEWKLINESFHTLGLNSKNTVGGPIGSKTNEMDFEDDDMGSDDMSDMGDDMGDDADMETKEVPCPDCNPDGANEEGDPNCETCHGMGKIPDESDDMGDDMGDMSGMDDMGDMSGEEDNADPNLDVKFASQDDLNNFKQNMSMYAKKYNRSFMDKDCEDDKCDSKEKSKEKPSKKDSKDEKKDFVKKFMKNFKKDDKKDSKENKKKDCKEDKDCLDEFFNSLRRQSMAQTRFSDGVTEDSLIEPQPGEVGYAPQGMIGSVGSGVTMDDIKEIPVMEGKFPTLAEYIKNKNK